MRCCLSGRGVHCGRREIVFNLLSLFGGTNSFSFAILARALATLLLWLSDGFGVVGSWQVEQSRFELHDDCGHVVAAGPVSDGVWCQTVVEELQK